MRPPFPDDAVTNFSPTTANGTYFFLSNFYSAHVMYEGIGYPTTEHAYQAAKSLDTDIRMMIMRLPTPKRAKEMGGTIALREDWDTAKFKVMRDILELKFAPNSVLAAKLRLTGERHLIEGNYWHDRVWGQCHCIRHQWDGENHLGLMLMEIRDERAYRPTGEGRVCIP